MTKEKQTKSDRVFHIIDCILICISVIMLIILLPQQYHDKKYNCNDVWDNDTQSYTSSGCREECGCTVISEYNIVVPVNEVEEALGDIIYNITKENREWQK